MLPPLVLGRVPMAHIDGQPENVRPPLEAYEQVAIECSKRCYIEGLDAGDRGFLIAG